MILNFLIMFFEFLNKMQGIILLSTVIATISIYLNKGSKEITARAKTIYFQIKEIESNFDFIAGNVANNNFLQSNEMYKSKIIFEINYWEKNKTFISRKLSFDDINLIDNFYSDASAIKKEQSNVSKLFFSTIKIMQKTNYKNQLNEIYNIINPNDDEEFAKLKKTLTSISKKSDIIPNEYLPNIHNIIIQERIRNFRKITGTPTYEKIKKLAKIKF